MEVRSIYALEDRQPDLAWDIMTEFFAPSWGDDGCVDVILMTADPEPVIELVVSSSDGDYPVSTTTTSEMLTEIENRSMSQDDWLAAARN